jgi:hypothetical protein
MRTAWAVILVVSTFVVAPQLRAQHGAPPIEQMQKLAFLHGRWEGTGMMLRGPGTEQPARVVETVQPKLGGAILLIEGVGRIGAPGAADEKVVHHALGVISFDTDAKQYRMRAYRADGRFVDPELVVEDKRIVWTFTDPRAGTVRYTITVNDNGQWHELGEMSRDGGKSFSQFFEMTLDRKGDAAADRGRERR